MLNRSCRHCNTCVSLHYELRSEFHMIITRSIKQKEANELLDQPNALHKFFMLPRAVNVRLTVKLGIVICK